MKSLTLAAGLGSRLRPLTNEIPKCMVEFQGRPILEHQLLKLREFGINRNYVVTGYCRENVNLLGSSEIFNPLYRTTNMVYSWSLSRHLLDEKAPLVISYGDIIYNSNTLSELLATDSETFGIVSDQNWENYWRQRAEDYLGDVESFSVDNDGIAKSI